MGKKKVKGGQAQGPLVKSVHIPLLSEGIRANPGLLRRKRCTNDQNCHLEKSVLNSFDIHPQKDLCDSSYL